MLDLIHAYETYLTKVKQASANTVCSYMRDIRQFTEWLQESEHTDIRQLLVGLIILQPINRNVHWHAFLSVVSGHIIVIAGYVRIFGENVTSIKFLVWKPWENMNQHIHGAMRV